jgi:hypothetical protein
MQKTLMAAIVVAGASCGVGCVEPNPDAREAKRTAADAAGAKKRGGGKNAPDTDSNPEGIGQILGRTADHPSLSGKLLLAGGIISRCPLSSEGISVGVQAQSWTSGLVRYSAAPGSTTRDVAIYLQRVPILDVAPLSVSGPPSQGQEVKQGQSTITYSTPSTEQMVVVPLAAPRKVWIGSLMFPVNLPGSAEVFPALKNARRESPNTRKVDATLEGAPHWWVLCPGWTQGATGLDPTIFLAELYSSDPEGGAAPMDVAVVARRSGTGPWQPASGYLLRGERLMRATAVIENDLPARVECVEVLEPPLEDFLVSKEVSIPGGRVRTGVLLTAKNRTLPKMLREGASSALTELLTRIEKTILDLSHERELVNNLAQQAIESGGKAGGLPELSLVYKERIEVLKPMLSAIRDEIANRGK